MYDLGIVLSHDYDETGNMSDENIKRIEEGLRLYSAGKFKKLVMSGGFLHGYDFSIASKMAAHAASKGFSQEILLEDLSLDTVGQLVFLKEGIIDPQKIKSFVLITHYWHSAKTEFMANSFFDESYNFELVPLEPTRYKSKRREDFAKLPLFIKSFPAEEIKKSMSLAKLLMQKHPFYNGHYPEKDFSEEFFLKNLERLKRQNIK